MIWRPMQLSRLAEGLMPTGTMMACPGAELSFYAIFWFLKVIFSCLRSRDGVAGALDGPQQVRTSCDG